ncbi:MAG: hypothetical protein ACE5G2_13600, partial [Candidatus Krumholzibacteriia bacterium]
MSAETRPAVTREQGERTSPAAQPQAGAVAPRPEVRQHSPAVPSGLRVRNTSLILPSILLITDLLVLECAFLCVYWTRFLSGWFPVPKGVPDLSIYL